MKKPVPRALGKSPIHSQVTGSYISVDSTLDDTPGLTPESFNDWGSK
jgi:hypothetical protein